MNTQPATTTTTTANKVKRLKLQRRLLLLLWQRQRPLHKRTSVGWQKRQAGRAIGSKANLNTCCISLQLNIAQYSLHRRRYDRPLLTGTYGIGNCRFVHRGHTGDCGSSTGVLWGCSVPSLLTPALLSPLSSLFPPCSSGY